MAGFTPAQAYVRIPVMSRRADRAILFCVALCFTSLVPAVAAGQDISKLLVAAYSLRRRGRYTAAAAAFEQILSHRVDHMIDQCAVRKIPKPG